MTGLRRFLVAAGLTLGLCVSAQGQVRIQGAGSTFVAPIMQRWVTEYQKIDPSAQIDYQSIGSGGGIKSFIEKTVDFGASDAPLSKKQLQQAGGANAVVQVPVIAGAVVAGYNLPGVRGELKFDGATLADIFQEKIKNWNDPRIAQLNPGVHLPAMGITPTHRTDGSGTTFIFTSYLCTQSPSFKENVGSATAVEWPGGAGGKGSEGVTQVVQTTPGAIGYIELAYALQSKVPFALIKNSSGKYIKATPQSTSAAGEGALRHMDSNNASALWNQPGPDVYPIAGFTYLFVHKDLSYLKDRAKGRALASFVEWVTHDGQKLASELAYAPLSSGVQKRASEACAKLTWAGAPLLNTAGR